jgi:catechol 2,3-dioxygenase-like lactoylglutathione lyase family enzyme
MQLDRILETVLYCPDLPAATAFYRDVLGLTPAIEPTERHAFFRCGSGMLLLFSPEITRRADVVPAIGAPLPEHGASGHGHMAFAVSSEQFDAYKAQLAARGVAIEQEVAWPQGGRSLYFRDPAGNCLEFATPDIWGV